MTPTDGILSENQYPLAWENLLLQTIFWDISKLPLVPMVCHRGLTTACIPYWLSIPGPEQIPGPSLHTWLYLFPWMMNMQPFRWDHLRRFLWDSMSLTLHVLFAWECLFEDGSWYRERQLHQSIFRQVIRSLQLQVVWHRSFLHEPPASTYRSSQMFHRKTILLRIARKPMPERPWSQSPDHEPGPWIRSFPLSSRLCRTGILLVSYYFNSWIDHWSSFHPDDTPWLFWCDLHSIHQPHDERFLADTQVWEMMDMGYHPHTLLWSLHLSGYAMYPLMPCSNILTCACAEKIIERVWACDRMVGSELNFSPRWLRSSLWSSSHMVPACFLNEEGQGCFPAQTFLGDTVSK